MAGLGRRTFAAGEVLTASNVMGYLQDQAVMNFAGTAARGSAVGTAVSEGMVSYLADSNDVQVYDGSSWKSIGPKGQILQMQTYEYNGTLFSTTNTYVTTGLTGTITPRFATSKILVIVNQNGLAKEQADTYGKLRLVRIISSTTTELREFERTYARSIGTTNFVAVGGAGTTYLDSPNTTSTITYRTEFANVNAAGFVAVQQGSSYSNLILIEVSE